MRLKGLLALAGTLALSGCLLHQAAPSSSNLMVAHGISVPVETYGYNPNPPVYEPAIPLGQPFAVPPGRGAMSIFVSIPRKGGASGSRSAQYIDFSAITKVVVTIVGQNVTSPITTTLNVQNSSTAEGTVLVPAGANQIVTAKGYDNNGDLQATVQGVATSVAGQVVNAVVDYGQTPVAAVFAGLPVAEAAQASLSAIAEVVDQVTQPLTASNGVVTYSVHPAFVNSPAIIQAIEDLASQGTPIGSISSASIDSELFNLGDDPPKYAAGAVTFELQAPGGTGSYTVPSGVPLFMSEAVFNAGGQLVGAGYHLAYQTSANAGVLNSFSVSDPVTSYLPPSQCCAPSLDLSAGQSAVSIPGVPPGTYSFYFQGVPGFDVSAKPWIVLLPQAASTNSEVFGSVLANDQASTLSVSPGATTSVVLQMADASKPSSISASGGGDLVSSGPYEWDSFAASANTFYTITFSSGTFPGGTCCYIYDNDFRILDQDANELYYASTATASYSYASSATASLYLYLPVPGSTVSIQAQPLSGTSNSAMNATVNYGQ